ncbi:hypothetical protein EKD04_020700 [Chloroflexales bacterium ZM16-3]|nr:hypothetical protein [Chloroflexales bacterium ZM16-3]
MANPHDGPFAAYLRRLDARLRGLPDERRSAIQRELLAHLADAATEQGADPADPQFQRQVITALGPDQALAAQFGQIHGGIAQILRRAAFACGLLGGLLGVLAAPFASGLFGDAGPLTLPLLLLFLTATGLGLAGVLRLDRQRPGGAWRVAVSVAVLLTSGLQLLYAGDSSLDPLGGMGLLLAGELLLIALVATEPALRLRRIPRAVAIGGALLLVSFVAPFSALPNPLGAYYLFAGGYRYAPHGLLVNRFATLHDGDPSALVTTRLDQLIGQTGLTPLDPHQPLISYTVRGVVSGGLFRTPEVAVDLRFATGETQQVAIPALDTSWGGLTSLDDLTTPHLPLPGLPPADERTPVQFGDPTALPVHPLVADLVRLGGEPMQATRVRWAPNGQALLIRTDSDLMALAPLEPGLWVAPLDGGAPTKLAGAVIDARWSADSRTVVALHWSDARQHQITSYDLATGRAQILGSTDRSGVAVVGDHVYFLDEGVLWRAALAGGAPERLAALPDADAFYGMGALAVAPDGERIAYRCGSDLCLTDVQGRLLTRLALGFAAPQALASSTAFAASTDPNAPSLWSFELAWSPDGQQFALATAATDLRGRPTMRILSRDGEMRALIGLGPDGAVDAPQWLPAGKTLILTTYPAGGRRIVAVTAATGTVADLTKPHWDAFGSVRPDGGALLLWNGRGGLWVAPVQAQA